MDAKQRNQFWSEIAKKVVSWIKPWQTICRGGFLEGDVQWFCEGQLNVSANCLDKHLPVKALHPAIIWQGDEEDTQLVLSFSELHEQVCRMANVLKKLGIQKGDCVAIYLPLIPEAAISMLACARIGAVHTVIFAGFSAQALRERLLSSQSKLLITADGFQRGGVAIALKIEADKARLPHLPILLIQHDHKPCPFTPSLDFWWHELKLTVTSQCEPTPMEAEDPLFILYTSGSTGQPKGLVHCSGGYLVQVASTHQAIFQCQEADIFWCTADIGWITGHSYGIYGPLCNGITTLLFSGVPTWPKPDRYWKIIDKYQVNILYTAPTAIRAIKRMGDQWLSTTTRSSLKRLGTVGEPINPDVWQWYFTKVGQGRCPIVDTWWQTETGAIMLSPQTTKAAKPGAACQPLPGIEAVLLNENYQELAGTGEGALAIKYPWPSLARTILNDHPRYCATYFKQGYYISGDGAHRDEEGDYWIDGRIDDVINVSGHRLGTAEIENALLKHEKVAEAAVVGVPHPLKGQAIYAFITLKKTTLSSEELEQQLTEAVKQGIGALAKPNAITIVEDLPKTRSGKIMRRLLRRIASEKVITKAELGDLSTLANPESIEELLRIAIKHF